MEHTNAPNTSAENAELIPVTLEAIYTDKIFETKSLNQPHWLRDGKRFSYLDKAPDSETLTLWTYDAETGARAAIIPLNALQLPADRQDTTSQEDPKEEAAKKDEKPPFLTIHGYQWSPDESRILFARTPRRRNASGDVDLYIYTLATGGLDRVSLSQIEHRNVKWSPDGSTIGYVREDDLYLLDLATGQETRLTDTAAPAIYNGRFGWVYEEELDLADGWAWSPDGRYLAYYQIDEREVPEIDLSDYNDLHIKPIRTRYPKAGDPNPKVKIGIIDLRNDTPETRWLDLGPDPDIYIARMQWTPQDSLLLQRLPRLQSEIELLLADPETSAVGSILKETDPAWVDPPGDLTFVEGTDQFLWPSDRSGDRHLYLYDLSGSLLRPLTEGEWDVNHLFHVDASRRLAYFTASPPTPIERQIFRVSLDGGEVEQISAGAGVHSPLFSSDGSLYLDTCSARSIPPEVRLHRSDGGGQIAVVLANPMPKLQNVRLGAWEFTSFETSDGVSLNAALIKPADFDPTKRYPVLMYTYGGPASQVVMNAWIGGWEQFLVSQGYVVALVDGRGSGMRGREFKKQTYLKLGHYEVGDQIEGAKWLGSLPWVDASRIGIWGWSYGGYMASLCILRGAEVFRTAVAVAPVTHWDLYDSIYTERFMRRPIDNPTGYAETTPLTLADKLKGHFLLIHGTADDNVHFQNAARLAAEFQKLNKPFRMMAYPGKKHGIEGVSLHVYTTIMNFILETL